MEKKQKMFSPKNAHTANTKSNQLTVMFSCNRLYAANTKTKILAGNWIFKEDLYVILILLSIWMLTQGGKRTAAHLHFHYIISNAQIQSFGSKFTHFFKVCVLFSKMLSSFLCFIINYLVFSITKATESQITDNLWLKK